jgi:hypothetical protein
MAGSIVEYNLRYEIIKLKQIIANGGNTAKYEFALKKKQAELEKLRSGD